MTKAGILPSLPMPAPVRAVSRALFGLGLILTAAQPAAAQEKRLSYTAREGTWMQLDVAPDGKTILFELLGDIYSMPVGGGKATPVLTGSPYERNPVYSPNGKQIAFISDRSGVTNLWVADADGSNARQITHDTSLVLFSSPAWAPDGKSLLVSRAVHSMLAFELWRVPVTGAPGAVVVKAQPNGEDWDNRINAMGAVISPDGRYAYYATKHGHTWTENDPPSWWIARTDLKSGESEAFIKSDGGAMRPVLSHDGKLLVYASRDGQQTGLRLRNLETGADRWLAFPVDHDAQEGGYYADLLPRFAFTPDDRAIVMPLDGGFARLDMASGAVSRLAFEAPVDLALQPNTRVQQVAETGPVRVHIAQAPRLSPDGRRIAFTALGGLYVQTIGSKAPPRRLVDGDAFQPAWSPDGSQIAYVSWTAAEGGHLWSIARDGGTPRRLTPTPAFYTEPVFAPDGRTLAVLRANHFDRLHTASEIANERSTDVMSIDPATGSSTVLAHGVGIRGPHYSADGRLWLFGPAGLRTVEADGTLRDRVKIVARAMGQYVGVPLPVEDARISPSGQQILVKAASELYLVPLPAQSGDEVPTVNVSQPGPGQIKLTRVGADFLDWSQDGRTIAWSVGATHRRIATAGAAADSEAKAAVTSLSVSLPRDVARGTLLLRGATVLPMDGSAPIADADILIRDDRIAAVGAKGSFAVPAGATIRDMAGKFIVPGFIDTHAHYFGIRRAVQDKTQWEFAADLAFGITASLEVQAFTPDIFTYADMIDTGMMPGPRAWSTGPGVFVNSEIVSKAAAVDVLTRYRDDYRTRNIKSYMVGDRAARQYMTQASRELGMMPTTEGASDFVLGMTHAVDGFAGNEHTLPVTPLHEDVVRLYAESKIGYNPTLSVLYGGGPALFDFIINKRPQDDPRLRYFTPPGVVADKLRNRHWMPAEAQSYQRFAADAVRIARAGGLVGMGSHGEVHGLGFHWEMLAYASGGATPMEVLRAATIDGATIIGHARDVGSITPGKFADMVVLSADPLADIANTQAIAAVIKGGRIYDPMTLASDWPDARAAPPRWFADETPAVTPGLEAGAEQR